MAGGAGALGFGGGFGKGLANVLLQNRQNQREDAQRAEARKDREFQLLFPVKLEAFKADPTPESAADLEEWIGVYFPDAVKEMQKQGMSFDQLAPLFQNERVNASGQAMPSTAISETGAIGREPSPAEAQARTRRTELGLPTAPTTPVVNRAPMTTAVPNEPAPPTPGYVDFLGGRYPTRSTQREQAITAAQLPFEATVQLAQRLVDQGVYPDRKTALEGLGALRPPAAGETLTPGSPEEYVVGKVQEYLADPANNGQPPSPDEIARYRRQYEDIVNGTTKAEQMYGTDREAASLAMYDRNYGDLTPEERQDVQATLTDAGENLDSLTQTVTANPVLWGDLPATIKAKLAPSLAVQGFDFAASNSMTPSMAGSIRNLTTSLDMLQTLDTEALSQREGRVPAWMTKAWNVATNNENDKLYDAVSRSMLSAMARSSGEVGNLAEAEQQRYDALRPKATDATNVRKAKYAAIQRIIDRAAAGATADELRPFLNYLQEARGETPTAAPEEAVATDTVVTPQGETTSETGLFLAPNGDLVDATGVVQIPAGQ